MNVLQTDRLVLRWLSEQDAGLLPDLLEGSRMVAPTADDLAARYWKDGYGPWLIQRRSDGVPLGVCGLAQDARGTDDSLVCAVAPRFRRNGFAREAATACLHYGRDVLGLGRILATVSPGDRAAARLVESIGMTPHARDAGPQADAVFAWGAPREARGTDGAKAAIDDLVRRFFSVFTNRGAVVPRVAAIPSMFLPRAVVTIVKPGTAHGAESFTVPEFIAPRAQLLFSGRLIDFHEHEVASETQVVRALAHRSTRYRKAGTLDGASFEGGGNKSFQLVETPRGWKIAALAWEDDSPG